MYVEDAVRKAANICAPVRGCGGLVRVQGLDLANANDMTPLMAACGAANDQVVYHLVGCLGAQRGRELWCAWAGR